MIICAQMSDNGYTVDGQDTISREHYYCPKLPSAFLSRVVLIESYRSCWEIRIRLLFAFGFSSLVIVLFMYTRPVLRFTATVGEILAFTVLLIHTWDVGPPSAHIHGSLLSMILFVGRRHVLHCTSTTVLLWLLRVSSQ